MVEAAKVQRRAKASFTKEEDRIIFDFIELNGISKISELINQITNRTARQIRERYRLYLDPSVCEPFLRMKKMQC
jgi:hypothetical protein